MSRKTQLNIQTLESRALMSGGGSTIPVGISLNAFGTLNIKGDEHRDWVTVSILGDEVHAWHQHRLPGSNGAPDTYETFQDKFFPLSQVKRIYFTGGDNGDSFTNYTSMKSAAAGGAGDDVLTGGSGADTLNGGDGDDWLEGRGGNDELRGGHGSDWYVYSTGPVNYGSDTIIEAANADVDTLDFDQFGSGISLDLGNTATQLVTHTPVIGKLSLTFSDTRGIEDLIGTAFADRITGNARHNVLDGWLGNDTVEGYGGNDSLWGGEGNDVLWPMNGDNTVHDGAGNDVVDFSYSSVPVTYFTEGGNDTVIGSSFADYIVGSAGNDSILGGNGNDKLGGSGGDDTIVGGYGDNILQGGAGDDKVDFSLNSVAIIYTTEGGNDVVIGTSKDDVITGSDGNDTLYGGKGNDHLYGKGGDDMLFGNAGDDWLEAGSAAEKVDGGPGTDYNAHRWAVDGTMASDIHQGGLGSCVFLSTLAGAADRGFDLASRITYLGNFSYKVRLYNLATGLPDDRLVLFNGTIYKRPDGTRIDPYPATEGEFWTILYQRAYVQMSDKADLDFTDPDDAMFAVTGRSVDTRYLWMGDPQEYRTVLAAGKVVIAGWATNTTQVYDSHAYTVLNAYQSNGVWRIKLRNPWGHDVKASDIASGTKVACGSNSDGIIDMKWTTFTGYNNFDLMAIS